MQVNLITPTRLSLIDMSSMGDSAKRGDDSTIGQFDSGLKYAIALLLRADVNFGVSVFFEGKKEEEYFFDSTMKVCDTTGKEKELITIHQTIKPGTIITGFARNLGYNWELWMALRELWSNMLDENGYMAENDDEKIDTGTIMTLEFDETNPFFEIWQNRHLYINNQTPLYTISSGVDILENPENYLRIYKQNILVYENKERPSRFAFNVRFGNIDERRILSDLYAVEGNIVSAIQYCRDEAFLREIIKSEFEIQEGEFLSKYQVYGPSSDIIHNIAAEIYEEGGQVQSYDWLIVSVKRRLDCRIGGKKITTVSDAVWAYSKEVTVESVPVPFSEPDIVVDDIPYQSVFSAQISKFFNFKLDVEVRMASLKGSKVVADKFAKCLIIDESFKVESDMPEFLVQYIDLTTPGNVITNMSIYLCNLIKK